MVKIILKFKMDPSDDTYKNCKPLVAMTIHDFKGLKKQCGSRESERKSN